MAPDLQGNPSSVTEAYSHRCGPSVGPSITRQGGRTGMDEQKVRENRARRAARRQGLALRKSKQRDPHGLTHGTYMLVDAATEAVIAASWTGSGYGLTLAQIEEHLFRGAR
jgi:hypothetical protein